ncbi:MAG: hypothetical protein FJ100_09215 [Deltaproteobacteria bacterium]|nr:hypothetical protein [Deltaproteobacteria bacterium]
MHACYVLVPIVVIALAAADADACTVTLSPDGNTAAIQHAIDRPGKAPPVVCLKPGVYRGARLLATRSATIRRAGRDKVVLDAGGQGRVLTVVADGVDFRFEGVTLTNGRAERGGAVENSKASSLTLTDCWLFGNTATLHGGGAIAASAGSLHLIRTRATGNSGDRAAALELTGTVRARLLGTLVVDNEAKGTADPPVRLSGQARLDVIASTIAYNSGSGIVLQPDGPGRRTLHVASSIVMGRPDAITVARGEAGDVAVEHSVLWGGYGFVALDLHTQRGLPGFSLKGSERYRPERGSVAIGLGQCADPAVRMDLTGKPRPHRCTVGALEAPPGDVAATLADRKKAQTKQKPKDWRDI